MPLSYSYIILLHNLLVLIFFILNSPTQIQAQEKKNLVSSILIFGDSTDDPGNNNYILTPVKSNFKLYERNIPNYVSTGRFTNGKLAYDFIECDLIIKTDGIFQGISSEIGGSYWERGNKKIDKRIFIVSIGTNDFIANYKIFPIRIENYTVPAYIDFLLQHVHNFLQELLDQGARKIARTGLPPMGCLPSFITLNSNDALSKRDCVDSSSSIDREYNSKLQNKLNVMQIRFANLGPRIAYLEGYKSTLDIILDKKLYGDIIMISIPYIH